MNRFSFFLSLTVLFGVLCFATEGLWAQTPQTISQSVVLSEAQWVAVQDRFEREIGESLKWLKEYQSNRSVLTADIADLQNKTAQLRSETRSGSNVFKDLRLKELLNELRDKLEENSKADREADVKQRDFEQKCLSLIDLYNNRIELVLAEGDISSSALDQKVNRLSELARRRNQVQTVLNQNRKREKPAQPTVINVSLNLKTDDHETLQLTVDLFKDRQKTLKDQMEKLTLELDGIRNELKLQGEMRDFLKDIQTLNEDSSFPQGDLKQQDIEFLSTDSHKKKLTNRLNEVQQKILTGQKEMLQIDMLLSKVQTKLDRLEGNKKL